MLSINRENREQITNIIAQLYKNKLHIIKMTEIYIKELTWKYFGS